MRSYDSRMEGWPKQKKEGWPVLCCLDPAVSACVYVCVCVRRCVDEGNGVLQFCCYHVLLSAHVHSVELF